MADTHDKIITVLEDCEGEGVTARHIAKQIFGEEGRPTMVNPELYRMEKAGLVRKEGERPPMWFLAEDPLVAIMRKIDTLSLKDQEKLRAYMGTTGA